MPAPGVRVELLDHGLILVRIGEIRPCARAGHGRTEEHVDDEHEEEEDPEHDAKVEEPRGMGSSALTVRAQCVHI